MRVPTETQNEYIEYSNSRYKYSIPRQNLNLRPPQYQADELPIDPSGLGLTGKVICLIVSGHDFLKIINKQIKWIK